MQGGYSESGIWSSQERFSTQCMPCSQYHLEIGLHTWSTGRHTIIQIICATSSLWAEWLVSCNFYGIFCQYRINCCIVYGILSLTKFLLVNERSGKIKETHIYTKFWYFHPCWSGLFRETEKENGCWKVELLQL